MMVHLLFGTNLGFNYNTTTSCHIGSIHRNINLVVVDCYYLLNIALGITRSKLLNDIQDTN